MKKSLIPVTVAVALACALSLAVFSPKAAARDGQGFGRFQFVPGTLVLTRSVYVGTASTITVGQTLPPTCVNQTVSVPIIGSSTPAKIKVACGVASVDGTFPQVFNNDTSDGSFGITSPIFLDDLSTDGFLIQTLPIPDSQIVTSFSSKSELGLSLSQDGRSLTFGGYVGGPGFVTGSNQFDVSNSNTPGLIDPTNPANGQYYRSVAEVEADGTIHITDSNSYSGDNGRAAMKAGGLYYRAGNDNNGGLKTAQLTTTIPGLELIAATGAELVVPGATPPAPPDGMIGNFSITQVIDPQTGTPYAADKPGKDDNFRGLTVFNNTLYVTKGSGGNGINTVYQVGTEGTLPQNNSSLGSTPITILPGFPTTLASPATVNGVTPQVMFPFGIWFADDHTLYVCDEGDGTLVNPPVNGNIADTSEQQTAGLQKWIKTNGTWNLVYTLQNGLNVGVPYTVSGYNVGVGPATGGCRNLTGQHNFDGTVTIFAVTSTVSSSGDQGADPNLLVKITDVPWATKIPQFEGFSFLKDQSFENFVTIRRAASGEVLRGVAVAPTANGFQFPGFPFGGGFPFFGGFPF
jgi:hypothetical protein